MWNYTDTQRSIICFELHLIMELHWSRLPGFHLLNRKIKDDSFLNPFIHLPTISNRLCYTYFSSIKLIDDFTNRLLSLSIFQQFAVSPGTFNNFLHGSKISAKKNFSLQ